MITSFDDNLKQLAQDMLETMYEHNGVGLAGPQVGVAKRIFVALETRKDEAKDDDRPPPQTIEEKRERWGVVGEHVIINPILSSFEGQAYDVEGCLSIPALYFEEVERSYSLHIRYQDANGETHERLAKGHFARVIQHETDHLDGILFLDRLTAEDKRQFMNENRQALAEMQREAKAFLKNIKEQIQPVKVA